MSLVIDNWREDTWIWLQTQSIVFTMPESRLLPLLRKAGIPGIAELVQKVKGGSTALTTQVVEAMTTNETFFFRDKSPFDHFRDSIMPEMLRLKSTWRKSSP